MPANTFSVLLPPRRVLFGLFSFEATLVLYLFAGIFKEDPRFSWIPGDATAVFFGLSVLIGGYILLTKPIPKKGLPVIAAMICFIAWFWISQAWSPSRIYGPDKVFFMATLELWALIAAALIIAPDPERVRRLFTLLLLLSALVGFETIIAYLESGGKFSRIRLQSGGNLTIGRICGLGALVAITAWLYDRNNPLRVVYLGTFAVLAFVLAVAGGRGPLLATAAPLIIPAAFGIRLAQRKFLFSPAKLSVLLLPFVIFMGLSAYSAATGQRLGTIDRLQGMVRGGELSGTAAVRAGKYSDAVQFWSERPLVGHGVGAWPLLTRGQDLPRYPHNIFMELLVEGGLVALILYGALVLVAFRSLTLDRLRVDPLCVCATMLFFNTFINSLVSSDLAGNRAMFLVLGLLVIFAYRPVVSAVRAAPRSAADTRGGPLLQPAQRPYS